MNLDELNNLGAGAVAMGARTTDGRPVLRQGVLRIAAAAGGMVRGWWAFWRQCARRVRQRRQLAALDDRMLRDIGASRLDVWRISRKPFWRD